MRSWSCVLSLCTFMILISSIRCKETGLPLPTSLIDRETSQFPARFKDIMTKGIVSPSISSTTVFNGPSTHNDYYSSRLVTNPSPSPSSDIESSLVPNPHQRVETSSKQFTPSRMLLSSTTTLPIPQTDAIFEGKDISSSSTMGKHSISYQYLDILPSQSSIISMASSSISLGLNEPSETHSIPSAVYPKAGMENTPIVSSPTSVLTSSGLETTILESGSTNLEDGAFNPSDGLEYLSNSMSSYSIQPTPASNFVAETFSALHFSSTSTEAISSSVSLLDILVTKPTTGRISPHSAPKNGRTGPSFNDLTTLNDLSNIKMTTTATPPTYTSFLTTLLQSPGNGNGNIRRTTNTGSTNAHTTNSHTTNPLITNPHVTDPHVTNPHVTNTYVTNPNVNNAPSTNPPITNAHITNANTISAHTTNVHTTNTQTGPSRQTSITPSHTNTTSIPTSSTKLTSSSTIARTSNLEKVIFPDLPLAPTTEAPRISSTSNPPPPFSSTAVIADQATPSPVPGYGRDEFVRHYLAVEKRLKSSSDGLKLSDEVLGLRSPSILNNTQAATSTTGNQNAGVVCYDDRTAIVQAEVDCPKLTVRKMAMSDHQLQEILKKSGAGDSPFPDHIVSPADVQEETIDNTDKPLFQAQVLKDKQIEVYRTLRRQITSQLTPMANREVITLTEFLKETVQKAIQGQDSSSRTPFVVSYDQHIVHEIKRIDAAKISTLHYQLEMEMLTLDSQESSNLGIEDMFDKIEDYNSRARKLLDLKEKHRLALLGMNETVGDILPKITSWVAKRHQHPKEPLKGSSATATESKSSLPLTSAEDESKPKYKVGERPINQTSLNDSGIVSILETSHEAVTKEKRSTKIPVNADDDVTDTHTSTDVQNIHSNRFVTEFERRAIVITELCHTISSKLLDFIVPEDVQNTTLNLLEDLHSQSLALKKEFFNQQNKSRKKRSLIGFSPDTCLQRGARVPNTDFLKMCGTCVKTTVLDTSYFPRHITEKVCRHSGTSATGQSGSVPVQEGCLNENGQSGGWCQQQTMTILLLRRNAGKCMKIVTRGQEVITDQWKLVAYHLRVGCECVVDKNSQFAKYLTFG